MRVDVVLGVITLILAVLGGIVSVHAPQKTNHKWAYGIAFFLLAVVGMVFVQKQSNEAAVANALVERSFRELTSKTEEVVRMQKTNEIQSEAILALTQRSLDSSSGGKSYPEIKAVEIGDKWSFVLAVHGATTLEGFKYNISRDADVRAGKDDALENDPENMSADDPHILETFSPSSSEEYRMILSAKNNHWTETLTLKQDRGHWIQHRTVLDKSGRIIVNVSK
jgi:hypothetical protein